MKNIAFIVNPISGTKTKNRVSKLIRELLDLQQFSPTVVTTEYVGHATLLAQHFALEGYHAVVAVGGDDTVNEVATGLVGSNTALGVVPNGSSNGFARHIDISTRMNRAIEMLNSSEAIYVDYATINDRPFFSILSIGHNAAIVQDFNEINLSSKDEAQTTFKNLYQHQPENYHLQGYGIDLTQEAFFISVANTSQFDAYIAPKTSVQDGWLDIALVTNSPVPTTEGLVAKEIEDNLYLNAIRTKELVLTCHSEAYALLDSSLINLPERLHIKIIEDGLKVLVKKRF